MLATTDNRLRPTQVEPLLKALSHWENCTVAVLFGGSVFEFKGPFPKGYNAQGYYNLRSGGQGFEGHLKLDRVAAVSFQDAPHRGQESYAFVFEDDGHQPIFKVFVGRNYDHSLITEQVETFKRIRDDLSV